MTRLSAAYRVNLEAALWIAGLAWLALSKPDADRHYTFCVFRRIGFRRCPGCGLGHSISYLFRGKLRDSLRSHPLGLFALVIILRRIAKLLTPPPYRRAAP
jgi:hypothetical protein